MLAGHATIGFVCATRVSEASVRYAPGLPGLVRMVLIDAADVSSALLWCARVILGQAAVVQRAAGVS